MATWRRKAIELFPELRRELNHPEYTIYWLFFDLYPEVQIAHRESDSARLDKIYGYAAWCIDQTSKEPANAAAVAFYEHLMHEPWMREAAAARLTVGMRADFLGLWEHLLSPSEFADVKRVLARVPPLGE